MLNVCWELNVGDRDPIDIDADKDGNLLFNSW